MDNWVLEIKEEEETGEAVIVITMDVSKANVFSHANLDAMERCLDTIDREEQYQGKGIVLTVPKGKKTFSAGLDLQVVMGLEAADFMGYVNRFDRLMYRLFTLQRPVVAAVTGHAIAGGFVFMCACEWRVGMKGSFKFGLNEVHMPAILPHASTEICKHAMGAPLIQEILLTGYMYASEEAAAKGMFHCVEENYDAVLAVAMRKAAYPQNSVKAYGQMKAMLQRTAIEAADDPAVGVKVFEEYYEINRSAPKSKL